MQFTFTKQCQYKLKVARRRRSMLPHTRRLFKFCRHTRTQMH